MATSETKEPMADTTEAGTTDVATTVTQFRSMVYFVNWVSMDIPSVSVLFFQRLWPGFNIDLDPLYLFITSR
jgi:hypothetical protein